MSSQSVALQAIATSAGVGGGGSPFAWNSVIKTVANDNNTVAASDEIYADTSGGAFTLLLPSAPTQGQRVRFADKKGTWTTNNLTINRNTKNIRGAAANFVLNVSTGAVEFEYTDATDGWIVSTNY